MVQYDPIPIGIIATIAGIFWLVSIIWIIYLLVRTLKKKKAGSKIKSLLTYRLSMAVILFQLFSAINFCIRRFLGAFRDFGISKLPYPNPIEETFGMLGTAANFITWTLLLLAFLARLYACFPTGSGYGYPKWFYIFIVSEIMLLVVLSFAGGIIANEGLKAIIFGGALLGGILNGIFLTYLFVATLKKAIKGTDKAHDNSGFINIMVKFVVLVSFSMSTSVLNSIFIAAAGVTGMLPLEALHLLLQPIDAAVNVLCLYLQFTFARDDYQQWLPKYHQFIQYLFTKETKSETEMKQQMSKDTVMSSSPSNGSQQSEQTEQNQSDLTQTTTVDSHV